MLTTPYRSIDLKGRRQLVEGSEKADDKKSLEEAEGRLSLLKTKLDWALRLGPRRWRVIQVVLQLEDVRSQVEALQMGLRYMVLEADSDGKMVFLNRNRHETLPDREGKLIPVRRLVFEDIMELCWYEIGQEEIRVGDELG